MNRKELYEKAKKALLADAGICKANRALFQDFFEFEERKLKRTNGLAALDEACCKTLRGYVGRFRNVNAWFKNKPWKRLAKEDIRRVYDALEDGHIKNRSGQPLADRRSYYNKVFKSKPFRLAGKAELAKEVIEYYSDPEKEVRYVTEEEFRKIVSVLSKPLHLLLCWLAWDIGENINTLLQLTPHDFLRQKNPDTGENEYLVNLPRDKIKRSRQSRSEPTLYPETIGYVDMALKGLKEKEPIFHFEHRQALKVIESAVKRSGAKCMPDGGKITWKDLRSGMACHLLKSGWSLDEVNARLGHKPSSRVLDAYINYLAIDRHKPKRKLEQHSLMEIKGQMESAKQREALFAQRLERQREENEMLRKELERTRKDVTAIRESITVVAKQIGKTQTIRIT